MVVVEVRQGTLGMDGRGWGPTGNTVRRGSQLDDEDDEEDEEDDEEEEEEDEEEEDEEKEEDEERKAADIKSNNPHLAGGEKCSKPPTSSWPEASSDHQFIASSLDHKKSAWSEGWSEILPSHNGFQYVSLLKWSNDLDDLGYPYDLGKQRKPYLRHEKYALRMSET